MNRHSKVLVFFSIACLLAAAPLQAATVNWISNGVSPQDQVFDNALNWDAALNNAAELYVNNDAAGQYPIITAGHAVDVDGIYLGNTTPGQLDITGTTQNFFRTLRIGQAVGTTTLNLSGATLNKHDTLGGTGGNSIRIGWAAGATANVNMTNGSLLYIPNTVATSIGVYAGGSGNIVMNNSTVRAGELISSGYCYTAIGNVGGAGSADLTDSNWYQITGNFNIGQSGGIGVVNLHGTSAVKLHVYPDGSFESYGSGWGFAVGVDNNSKGTMDMYDTSSVFVAMGAGAIGGGGAIDSVLTMHNSSKMQVPSLTIGSRSGGATPQGGKGTLYVKDNATITLEPGDIYLPTVGNEGNLIVGQGIGSTGKVELSTSASISAPNAVVVGTSGGSGAMTLKDASSTDIAGGGGDRLQIGNGGGSLGSLELNNDATFTMGQGNMLFGTGFMNTLPDGSTVANGGTGSLKMTGSSTFTHLNSGLGWNAFYIATHAGTIGSVDMSGGTSTIPGASIILGAGGVALGTDGGHGTLTMSDYSKITANDLNIGGGSETAHDVPTNVDTIYNGEGTLKMYGHSAIVLTTNCYVGNYSKGTLDRPKGDATLYDDAQIAASGEFVVGRYGGLGTFTLNGSATVTAGGLVFVGDNWGADDTGPAGDGTVDINGTALFDHTSATDNIRIGAEGGIGVWNQNGGTTKTTLPVKIGDADFWSTHNQYPGDGTLHLKGGTFEAPQLTSGATGYLSYPPADTKATVNFNGGVLKAATGASADFIYNATGVTYKLNVMEGGAKIDSNGNDIGTAIALTHAGAAAIDGGLTKKGAGRLTLTGPIGYTGPTVIEAGKLIINNGLTTNLSTVTGATGTFEVLGTSVVNATSIGCDTLQIGGVATAAVPEPSTSILIFLAGIGLLFRLWRKAGA
ncbi:MAG: autotransporter-associated beta strand repeat-containing protein [Pirellulales bacterium]|nr:autotransporter-associated beta strand repeat-containing protein [Pirellulales bacterium]